MKTLRLTIFAALAAVVPIAPLQAIDEAEALEVLAKPEGGASLYTKAMICDELGRVGTAKAVPALAKLLADKELHDYARDGLERIADPAAGKALLDALDRLEGNLRTGVIISLGDRGDEAAVPALAEIAKKEGGDAHATAAALKSLAQIATGDAGEAILAVLTDGGATAKTAAAHAALSAAQRMDKAGKRDLAKKLRAAAKLAGVPSPVRPV